MGDGDGCRYVGVDIGLGRVMATRKSLRRLLTLITVGLVLPNYLLSCVLCFSYCVFRFAKSGQKQYTLANACVTL